MNSFSHLSQVYDSFHEQDRYDAYLEFIQSNFQTHACVASDYQPRAVDLGCGTGEMAISLASKGFDVIGVDYSYDMLSQAMEKSSENPELDVFFIRQDIRNLHMDAKANLFISCFDCLNYLDNPEQLQMAIEGVARHCAAGGLFIFDVNTKYRFETYYGNHTFVFKKKDQVLLWENHYHKDTCQCFFDIEIFQKEGDLYRRSREKHKQTWFSEDVITRLLEQSGFAPVSLSTDRDLWGGEGEALKHIFVAKKI